MEMSFDWQHICYVWWACFSTVGIPMGTNYFFTRKRQTTRRVFWKNHKNLARSFNITFRYTDTVLSLNNHKLGDFVDLHLEIDWMIDISWREQILLLNYLTYTPTRSLEIEHKPYVSKNKRVIYTNKTNIKTIKPYI